MKMCDEGQPEKCVCVKGVPSRATSEDLLDFFTGLKIEESDIHILCKSRRCFGKAILIFQTLEDARLACSRDRDFLNPEKFGQRYVRVLPASFLEMEELLSKLSNESDKNRQDDSTSHHEGTVRATRKDGAAHELVLPPIKGKIQKTKRQSDLNRSQMPSNPSFTRTEQSCPTRLSSRRSINPSWDGSMISARSTAYHMGHILQHANTPCTRYVVHDLSTGQKVYLQNLPLDAGVNNYYPYPTEYDESNLGIEPCYGLSQDAASAGLDSLDLTVLETWLDTQTPMDQSLQLE